MYYSSESSDSDGEQGKKVLDFSELMLDSETIGLYLQNYVRDADEMDTAVPKQSMVDQAAKLYQKLVMNSNKVSDHIHSNSYSEECRLFDHKHYYRREKRKQVHLSHVCDFDNFLRVDIVTEKIQMQHNLMFDIPVQIIQFSHLRFLDVSNNNLTYLSDFLLLLPQLQAIYAKNNDLGDDCLPKNLPTLTKLKELNLSGNRLTAISRQILRMPSLKYLYLGNNFITEIPPDIKLLENLQVLHLGGNQLVSVPDEVGELQQLMALHLCENKLDSLTRAISNLKRLRTLFLHRNNLCCLPFEIVRIHSLTELSLRENPLVTNFVNSCASEVMFNPPSLLELAARIIKLKNVVFDSCDVPRTLQNYLNSGHRCVNPKCKGLYFTSCVEHIKFVDFCGKYRVPLMHYLCSSRCSSRTPPYYQRMSDSDSEEDLPAVKMKKVLLG